MCKIYAETDPILYESRTRSLRVHGVVTTVRLENMFWNVVQEIAEREGLTASQLAIKLYDELITRHGEAPLNFASFLRVCCLRYMSRRALVEELPCRESDRGFRPTIVGGGPK